MQTCKLIAPITQDYASREQENSGDHDTLIRKIRGVHCLRGLYGYVKLYGDTKPEKGPGGKLLLLTRIARVFGAKPLDISYFPLWEAYSSMFVDNSPRRVKSAPYSHCLGTPERPLYAHLSLAHVAPTAGAALTRKPGRSALPHYQKDLDYDLCKVGALTLGCPLPWSSCLERRLRALPTRPMQLAGQLNRVL